MRLVQQQKVGDGEVVFKPSHQYPIFDFRVWVVELPPTQLVAILSRYNLDPHKDPARQLDNAFTSCLVTRASFLLHQPADIASDLMAYFSGFAATLTPSLKSTGVQIRCPKCRAI
jgi:hypothetical protein